MSPWTVSELLGSRQSKTTKPSFSLSPYINPPPLSSPLLLVSGAYTPPERDSLYLDLSVDSSLRRSYELRNAESRVRAYVSGRESVRNVICVLFVLIKSESM